jgi:hypothetical protein
MNLLPQWPNLNHFSNVLNVAFSDGQKFEDILKVCNYNLLYMLNWLPPPGNPICDPQCAEWQYNHFLLLKCLWSKAVLSMYIGLKVQTKDTIAAGKEEVLWFSSMILFFRENSHVLTVAVAWGFCWSCALAMWFSMATVHFPSAFGSDSAHCHPLYLLFQSIFLLSAVSVWSNDCQVLQMVWYNCMMVCRWLDSGWMV